jgi:Leucine-rich repeat (LRR) protein
MRIFAAVFVLIFSITSLSAQQQVPVYRSKDDSVKLASLTQQISEIQRGTSPASVKLADSLWKAYHSAREHAIIRMKYVYVANENFTSLPDVGEKNDPLEVTALSISGYKKKKLPASVYHCRNLQQLELVNTHITKLPRRLNKLRDLTHIEVYNNTPAGRLKLGRNNTVTRLKIRGESPEHIPGSFTAYKSLDTLDLARNHLTKFPRVGRNVKLRQLVLSENDLTLRQRRIRPNPHLQHLLLQRNKITDVPAVIGRFSGLKKLVLNYNSISTVAPEIGKLKDLEELGLYANELQQIPPGVFDLTGLKLLDLYFNKIEKVGDDIVKLKQLEILYLASNKIYSLSERIGELESLREVYLHHNRLSALPSSLAKLHQLEVLRFNANNLVIVPEWVRELNNLRNIDFSKNRIIRAPLQLAALEKLQIVAMTENPWENKDEVADLAENLVHRGVIVHLEQLDD